MSTTTRIESVATPDGNYDAHLHLPDGAPTGAGIVLLQEIFGVGDFILDRAAALAEAGYAVLCPDVFWRVERNVALPHDDEGLARAFGYVEQFMEIDPAVTAGDLAAALDHLRGLPEVTGGRVAAMGYCLGGRLAFELAVAADPTCCVSYYGSGIAGRLEDAARIACPVLFHFGGNDPYIANEDVTAIREAFADRADVEVDVQAEAGHAFENSYAAKFSDPEAASRSWPITVGFLDRWLNGEAD